MTRTARGRLVAFLILAVCAAPVVLGTLAFYYFPPAGRTNYGRLISPRPFALPARLEDGELLAPAALADKWWLVTLEEADCAETCSRKLLYTRQLRLAQGKDQDRVGRLLVLKSPGRVPLPLAEDLRTAVLSPGRVPALEGPLFDGENPTRHIYVVDPFGNLMMSFPSDGDPQRMLRDVERLLRVNSWERISR